MEIHTCSRTGTGPADPQEDAAVFCTAHAEHDLLVDRHERQQVLYHQHARHRRVRSVRGGQQDTERDEHDLVHVLAGMEPFRVPRVQKNGYRQIL